MIEMPRWRLGIGRASAKSPESGVGTSPTQLFSSRTSRAPCSTAMPTRLPAITLRSAAPTAIRAAPGPKKTPTSLPTGAPSAVTPIRLPSTLLAARVSRNSTPATRLAQITLPRSSACAESTTSTPSSLGSGCPSALRPIVLPITRAPTTPPPPITTPCPLRSDTLLPAIRLPQPAHSPPISASAAPPSTAIPLSRLGAAPRPSAAIPSQLDSTTEPRAAAPITPIP